MKLNLEVTPGFYQVCEGRSSFEKTWTKENYSALTECLSNLPVTWRYFAKHRVFAAIEAMDASDLSRSDGSGVRSLFEDMLVEFPDLISRKN